MNQRLRSEFHSREQYVNGDLRRSKLLIGMGFLAEEFAADARTVFKQRFLLTVFLTVQVRRYIEDGFLQLLAGSHPYGKVALL